MWGHGQLRTLSRVRAEQTEWAHGESLPACLGVVFRLQCREETQQPSSLADLRVQRSELKEAKQVMVVA